MPGLYCTPSPFSATDSSGLTLSRKASFIQKKYLEQFINKLKKFKMCNQYALLKASFSIFLLILKTSLRCLPFFNIPFPFSKILTRNIYFTDVLRRFGFSQLTLLSAQVWHRTAAVHPGLRQQPGRGQEQGDRQVQVVTSHTTIFVYWTHDGQNTQRPEKSAKLGTFPRSSMERSARHV